MPLFFFNFSEGGQAMDGGEGVEFKSFEAACIEAHRGMLEIGLEMVRDQRDPSRQTLEMTDASGASVLTLTFSDLLRPRAAGAGDPSALIDRLRVLKTRQKQLRDDLAEEIASAQRAVLTARGLLNSSKREHSFAPKF